MGPGLLLREEAYVCKHTPACRGDVVHLVPRTRSLLLRRSRLGRGGAAHAPRLMRPALPPLLLSALPQARKANETAVVEEKKRQKRGAAGDEEGDGSTGAKRKWFEEKQKRKVGLGAWSWPPVFRL